VGDPRRHAIKYAGNKKKPPGNKTHAVEYQQNKTRKKGKKK
jgi:hypothetical protein